MCFTTSLANYLWHNIIKNGIDYPALSRHVLILAIAAKSKIASIPSFLVGGICLGGAGAGIGIILAKTGVVAAVAATIGGLAASGTVVGAIIGASGVVALVALAVWLYYRYQEKKA